MTLRRRLFLLLGALVALLVAGQVVLVRSLTRELADEVGAVAVSVGESVAAAVGEEPRFLPKLPGEILHERQVRVIRVPPPGPDGPRQLTLDVDDVEVDEAAGPAEKGAVPEEGGELGEREVKHTVVKVKLLDKGSERTLVLDDGGEARAIPIPERGVSREVGRFQRRLLLGSLALAALGVVAAAVVAHRVSRPLAELAAAARRVGEGELGTQTPEPKDRDVGAAVAAFNRMSRELAQLDEHARALRAREHLAELGEVARGLAHSLRNPLHALGLSVDELAAAGSVAPGAGGEAADLAQAARRQIQRIDRSLRTLLVLAAEGAGPAPEPVDLTALAEDVALEVLQDLRGPRRNSVRVEVGGAGQDGAAPATVLGVAAELRAMVQALVVNAAEASPEGGQVKVGVAASADGATVEVSDQGAGLPAEVRSRLFSPHVTTKPTGSGMGLFLCHRLATTRYGGSLALEDAAGGGTRAVLELGNRRAAGNEGANA